MSESSEHSIDVTVIKVPEVAASEKPDEATSREIMRTRAALEKLTPTQLHDRAREAHIQDICQERRQLQQDLISQRDHLEKEIATLRQELDRLRPEHAKLEEAYAGTLTINIVSTILVVIGGSLISGAGYALNDIFKIAILFLGIATLLCGTLLQITSTWRSTVFRRLSTKR